jgi:hypothetical protein
LETRKISHFGISAARGGYVASEAVTAYMFFSLTLFEERHEKGDPRGNVLASFLVTSWDAPRSDNKKTKQRGAKLCARP